MNPYPLDAFPLEIVGEMENGESLLGYGKKKTGRPQRCWIILLTAIANLRPLRSSIFLLPSLWCSWSLGNWTLPPSRTQGSCSSKKGNPLFFLSKSYPGERSRGGTKNCQILETKVGTFRIGSMAFTHCTDGGGGIESDGNRFYSKWVCHVDWERKQRTSPCRGF